MNGKTRNTIEAVAVGITDCIANGLVEQVAVQGTPDGLVHNTKVFRAGYIGVVPAGEIKDEIAGEK